MKSIQSRSNYVWVVGGGQIQSFLVEEFKRQGYQILLSDQNPHCYCRHLVDDFVEVDTYDWVSHLDIACGLKFKPVAVMTAGTDVGPSVSAVAQYFDLPSCSLDSAIRTKDKGAMRLTLNHPHPEFKVVSAPSLHKSIFKQDMPLWKGLYPVVVKPTNSSASQGITFVDREEFIPQAVERAVANNKAGGDVLIEEALIGNPHLEASCDWFVWRGEIFYVNGTLRIFNKEKFGLESSGAGPWEPPTHVHEMARNAAMDLGVTEGPFKTDIIKTDRFNWCFLECATRWSGSFDHSLVAKYSTGRDLTKVLADYALGKGFDPSICKYETKQYVCQFTPLVPPGRLIDSEMHRTIRSNLNVLDIRVVKTHGVENPTTLLDRSIFIIAKGKSLEDAVINANSAWQGWVQYDRYMNFGGGDQ